MKRLLTALMLLMTISAVLAAPVWAYSYGDPNEEELAVMFKDAMVKIQAGDWAGAAPLYQAKRAEIESHFGAGVAITLDQSLEGKDQTLTEQNLKALLVLNLQRRFEYGEKDLNDYSAAKLLLAKARATYDALEPYIQAKLPNETVKLKAAFDAALEALGNPGLFGVGKKAVKPGDYKQQTSYILDTVRPIFPSKESQTSTATSVPSSSPVETASAAAAEKSTAPAALVSGADKAASSAGSSQPAPSTAANPAASTAAQDTSAAPSGSSSAPEPSVSAAASSQIAATPAPTTAAAATPAVQSTEHLAHAPMAQEDKTNTGVTFAVIGGVGVTVGGALWWARRKDFF